MQRNTGSLVVAGLEVDSPASITFDDQEQPSEVRESSGRSVGAVSLGKPITWTRGQHGWLGVGSLKKGGVLLGFRFKRGDQVEVTPDGRILGGRLGSARRIGGVPAEAGTPLEWEGERLILQRGNKRVDLPDRGGPPPTEANLGAAVQLGDDSFPEIDGESPFSVTLSAAAEVHGLNVPEGTRLRWAQAGWSWFGPLSQDCSLPEVALHAGDEVEVVDGQLVGLMVHTATALRGRPLSAGDVVEFS